MKFYTYIQNNSGGNYAPNMPEYLIVEAEDETCADLRAQVAGAYFDGCRDGRDCPCCGDRWSRAWEGTAEPEIYGMPVMKKIESMFLGYSIQIVYADGRKIDINTNSKR